MKIVDEIGNVQLMQRINRLKVIGYIRQQGPATRQAIAKATGLSPSSITNIVTHLMENNLVVEVGTLDSKEVGRKATLIKFNPGARNIININIEVSRVNIALTDLDGNIIKIKELQIDKISKDFDTLNLIKREINMLAAERKEISDTAISGIGIAVSGIVRDNEKLLISSSLQWKSLSLKGYFENAFNIPVYVQNISRAKATWKLKKDSASIEKNIVFLDLTRGFGAINFFEQKINEAVTGEFGHTTVKKDGPLCFCGNHGCLELLCSVENIIMRCQELLNKPSQGILNDLMKQEKGMLDYELILEAFEKGDREVKKILKECGEYLGIGIANIINVFNPQKIIINGDILLQSDFIYDTAIKEANARAYEEFTRELTYEKINIGMKESIRGLSIYITNNLFDLSGTELFGNV